MPRLGFHRAIAFLFKFQSQFGATRTHDASIHQHVDKVRNDVVQQALVVSYHDDGALRVAHGIDALGYDLQRVNADRFALVMSQVSGKRLTYAQLTGKGTDSLHGTAAGTGQEEPF